MTHQIAAAENMLILFDPGIWRLTQHTDFGPDRAVLEARPDGLLFNEDFALTRRLPAIGKLPAKYVRQVVVGWSHDDDAWHLGLLLARDLADIRGSRWCEVANWPDPDPDVFLELATHAGEALAQTLDVPFNLIEPRPEGDRPRPVELPPLPIDLGTWKLESVSDGVLALVRAPRWRLSHILRILWYLFWVGIFTLLSVATLENNLALPNSGILLPEPELLPYLGIGVTLVLLGMTAYLVYELLTLPTNITIDGPNGEIITLHDQRIRSRQSRAALQSIYVTHVIKQRRQRNFIKHGEINLYLTNARFEQLVEQEARDEEEADYARSLDLDDGVIPLQPAETLSDLQAVGLHIARTLGDIPCFYDQRTDGAYRSRRAPVESSGVPVQAEQ